MVVRHLTVSLCRWRRWWMLGPSLKRTSTYPASTSRGSSREPATKKGSRYQTGRLHTDPRISILSLWFENYLSHFIENKVPFNKWFNYWKERLILLQPNAAFWLSHCSRILGFHHCWEMLVLSLLTCLYAPPEISSQHAASLILIHPCLLPETHSKEKPRREAQTKEGRRHCSGKDHPPGCSGVWGWDVRYPLKITHKTSSLCALGSSLKHNSCKGKPGVQRERKRRPALLSFQHTWKIVVFPPVDWNFKLYSGLSAVYFFVFLFSHSSAQCICHLGKCCDFIVVSAACCKVIVSVKEGLSSNGICFSNYLLHIPWRLMW